MNRILFCTLLIATSLSATPITLADGELDEATSLDGQQAARVWDVGLGVTMTVQALSLFGPNFVTATTTQFGANAPGEFGSVATLGLGVCGATEVCWFNQWQIDNTDPGGRDFLLFTFSAPVNLGGLVIRQTTIYNTDSDAAYSVGANATLAALLSGLIPDSGPNLNIGDSRTIHIGASNVNQLLFGTVGTDRDDYFKAFSIDVTIAQAPEPGTLMLMGSALLVVGAARRRR